MSNNKLSKPSAVKAKAARSAEKEGKRKENILKVSGKSNDNAPVSTQAVKETKTPDVWERIKMEQQSGKKRNPVEGDESKKKTTKRQVTKTENRLSHHYQKNGNGPKCVVNNKGAHVRLSTKEAEKAVAEGGRYIPKNQYKGYIQHPKNGRIQPEWNLSKKPISQ